MCRRVDGNTKEVSNQIVRRSQEWHQPAQTILHTRHVMLIEPVSKDSRVIQLIQQVK